jgi:hypothetical protein
MQVQWDEIAAHKSPDPCQRRYPRAVFSVPIRIRRLMPGGVGLTHGISLDISEGGMGVLVENELKSGDVLEVDLQLPSQKLNAVAIVRHTSSTRSGFEFLGLTQEERRQIGEIVGEA